MLAITAAAAVIVASLFAFPPVVSAAIAGLMSVCIPAMLVGCLMYGGPGWRAFAVGMLVPTVLRLVTGLFGGASSVGGGDSYAKAMALRYLQQANIRTMRPAVVQTGVDDQGAFTYFLQLSEMWDKLGYAYMTDETLFWGASAVAGLATLFVQQRFARIPLKR